MHLGQDDPLETILPPAGELFWGTVAFGLVALLLIVAVVLIVRALTRPSFGDDRQAEHDELLERAVRAETERDHLRRELEELKRERDRTGEQNEH